ncbi:MAG: glutamate--tRNA ligase [Calditrichota bacterium]
MQNLSSPNPLSRSEIRVRFAPSPTGDLHVGGVRTALFNWLFARHQGGRFLLRIEDTDAVRSTPEAIQVILVGLQWLGLDWDEEPIYQSRGLTRHREAALSLLENGAAYRCFCTPEEIAAAREESTQKGEYYRYDRYCLKLSPERSKELAEAGQPFAVRLMVPEEPIVFTDGVHGQISVSGQEIDDFILLRSDGTPTYMLAVVADDIDMGITHIIRGDDHISNTPKQILIYRALNQPAPQFAHVPLILGPDKKRLSKRHGATSINAYRDAGYLPDTLVSYLGLLGWSPGDDRNDITLEELIAKFDIPGINPHSAVFDETKLRWLNGLHINRTPFHHVASQLQNSAEQALQRGDLTELPDPAQMRAAWEVFRTRLQDVRDLFGGALYAFRDPDTYDPKMVRKHFLVEGAAERLNVMAEDFSSVEPFDISTLETAVHRRAEEWGLPTGKIVHPLRLAVSGVSAGPGLYELLAALGRETVTRRLRRAAELIAMGFWNDLQE